jgi:hypothetical protein
VRSAGQPGAVRRPKSAQQPERELGSPSRERVPRTRDELLRRPELTRVGVVERTQRDPHLHSERMARAEVIDLARHPGQQVINQLVVDNAHRMTGRR